MMPGTKYQYSGGGYVVAEQLVLDSQHEPFAKYMHDSVLAPLGMSNSTFQQPLPKALWNRAAVATDANGKAYPGKWNVYPEQTAAGLWTTPTDLAKFMMGMQNALDGKAGAILSASTAREMLTPVKDHYGLGFAVHGTSFGHDGANAGFQDAMIMHRDGQGVAIMTDSDNGGQLAGELLNAIAAVYGWSEIGPKQKALYAVSPRTFARLTGTYDLDGQTFRVYQRGAALYTNSALGPPDRLYPEGPDTFFILDQDIDFRFRTASSGKVDAVLLMPFNGIAKKIKIKTHG